MPPKTTLKIQWIKTQRALMCYSFISLILLGFSLSAKEPVTNHFSWSEEDPSLLATSSPLSLEEKIVYYSGKIEKDSRDFQSYLNRGILLGKKGDLEDAVKDFSYILSIQPEHILALSNRGFALALESQFQASLSDYEKAISLSPGNAYLFNSRGYVYYLQGNQQKALEDFTKAIELDPKIDFFYYNRARLREEMKDPLFKEDLAKAKSLTNTQESYGNHR